MGTRSNDDGGGFWPEVEEYKWFPSAATSEGGDEENKLSIKKRRTNMEE